MTQLGNGLSDAGRHEDALSVREIHFASLRRWGSEESIIIVQSNLANSYANLGRDEDALLLKRNAYSGFLKLDGKKSERTLTAANNYAWGLLKLEHFEEVKALMRKTIPVARRVLEDSSTLTLMLRTNYARALYMDDGATLDDLHKAVTTLEDTARIARRVFGGAHPTAVGLDKALRDARAALRARDTAPSGSA